MLLDFEANPAQPSSWHGHGGVSRIGTLYVALRDGYYLIAALLLRAWGTRAPGLTDEEFAELLFIALHSHSRECVAVLLHGQEERALTVVDGKSVFARAVDDRTPLLSLLVAYGKRAEEAGNQLMLSLPDVKKKGRKAKINAALRLGDVPFPYERIERELDALVCPWKRLDEPVGQPREASDGW
jgi:DNA-binding CsgD family transcriptional regulator